MSSRGKKQQARLQAREREFDRQGLSAKSGFRKPGSMNAKKAFPVRKRGR